MSSIVSGWVWAYAPVKSGELVVLLALADNAHDDGGGSYPSRQHLCNKSRMKDRQVQYCLNSLEKKGLVARQGVLRNGRTIVWRVIMQTDPAKCAVSQSTAVGSCSGLQSLEPELNRPSSQGAGKLTISGKPVKSDVWARTIKALDEFNRQTNRSLGSTTGTGEPSESAKRIYARLAKWPDLTEDQISSMIRRTLSSKWWGDDQPSIGVVFGPKVFEDNLSRSGAAVRTKNGNGRVDEDYQQLSRVLLEKARAPRNRDED